MAEDAGFLKELRLRAHAKPEAAALLAPGREALTYGELWGQIDALASALRSAGLRRSDAVAVVMPDGPEMIALCLGVVGTAACAPLNPAFSEPEFQFYLHDFGARALIVQTGLSPAAEAAARSLGIEVWKATPASDRKAGVPALDCPCALRVRAGEQADAGEAALLLHTSATTGTPRLVPLTHSNLQAMAANTRSVLGLGESDRFLSMMPLFHLQGLMSSMAQLLAGGAVISTAGFDPENFMAWLEEFRPTWYTAGPALHSSILPLAQRHKDVLRRFPLRFVRSIGAPLPPELQAQLEDALEAPVLNGYGMTETGLVTSNSPLPEQRRHGSVGRAVGTEIAIVDEAGDELAPGNEGQIAVRGPAVIEGYRNNPEANRLAFRNGWFLTGDLGRLDSDGFLFVTGRLKEIINRGGEKILPAEVDEALQAHSALTEAAAFGVPHPTLGEDVFAAVVLKPGAAVTPAELRRFAASRLAAFKVPRRILFMDAVPRGATGKAQRRLLAERFQARQPAPAIPPSTPTGQKLADIWSRVLDVKCPGVEDDFFDLGGDSFSVALMLNEVESEFDIDRLMVEEGGFFICPTIAGLARSVDASKSAGRKGARSPLVALQPNGSRIPFFCFPGADENPYYFRRLAANLGPDQPFYVVRDPRPMDERGIYTVEEAAARLVDALRTIQPRGPYALGGHCYGGMLSFEVARRLLGAGEEVALVALFEVAAPGYPKVLRHWRGYLRQAALQVSALLRGKSRIGADQALTHLRLLWRLGGKRAGALVRRLLIRLRMKELTPPLEQVTHPNHRAAANYRPSKLGCKVVQFISAGEHHSTEILDDPRLGWREFAHDFEVRKVPGKAAELFVEPNVGALAAGLRELLDSIETPRAVSMAAGTTRASASAGSGG
jgi:acyl-CoA synthetase (AMP-forming)/AMP-acid ligase II/thioesterase domain-containing protein